MSTPIEDSCKIQEEIPPQSVKLSRDTRDLIDSKVNNFPQAFLLDIFGKIQACFVQRGISISKHIQISYIKKLLDIIDVFIVPLDDGFLSDKKWITAQIEKSFGPNIPETETICDIIVSV